MGPKPDRTRRAKLAAWPPVQPTQHEQLLPHPFPNPGGLVLDAARPVRGFPFAHRQDRNPETEIRDGDGGEIRRAVPGIWSRFRSCLLRVSVEAVEELRCRSQGAAGQAPGTAFQVFSAAAVTELPGTFSQSNDQSNLILACIQTPGNPGANERRSSLAHTIAGIACGIRALPLAPPISTVVCLQP